MNSRHSAPLLEATESEDPQVTQLRTLRRPISLSAIMLCGLFALGLVYFLYFARPILLPIAVAIMLNFLFDPLVRWAKRWGVPRGVAAVAVLLSVAAVLLVGGYLLVAPASEFMARVPERVDEMEEKLRGVTRVVERVQAVTEQVEGAVTPGQPAAPEEETPSRPPMVVTRGPTLFEAALGYGQSFGAGTVLAAGVLLLMLALDEIFLHKLVRVLPTFGDKKLAVTVVREIETDISRYLATITAINICLGIATGLALAAIGVPNPILWGTMAALANYIPYLGPFLACCVLALVGLVSFNSLGRAALPPLALLGLNMVEGLILNPLLVGKRLDLNPVMVFFSLTFWGFVWGIPGMIIATPLLVMIKITCDRIEALTPVSEFLSGLESPPAGDGECPADK